MPNCENCTLEHDGSYGSGRFCSRSCVCAFATKENREQVSLKISETLKKKGLIPKNPFPRGWNHTESGKLMLKKIRATGHPVRIPDDLVFVVNSGHSSVAKARFYSKTPDICTKCGQGPTWQNLPLRFHVDHKNGDSGDNRWENLAKLCPNCHSQTPTYAGRNVKNWRNQHTSGSRLAGDAGIEPTSEASKTSALPLDESPNWSHKSESN